VANLPSLQYLNRSAKRPLRRVLQIANRTLEMTMTNRTTTTRRLLLSPSHGRKRSRRSQLSLDWISMRNHLTTKRWTSQSPSEARAVYRMIKLPRKPTWRPIKRLLSQEDVLAVGAMNHSLKRLYRTASSSCSSERTKTERDVIDFVGLLE
jgi:hypothetical protein